MLIFDLYHSFETDWFQTSAFCLAHFKNSTKSVVSPPNFREKMKFVGFLWQMFCVKKKKKQTSLQAFFFQFMYVTCSTLYFFALFFCQIDSPSFRQKQDFLRGEVDFCTFARMFVCKLILSDPLFCDAWEIGLWFTNKESKKKKEGKLVENKTFEIKRKDASNKVQSGVGFIPSALIFLWCHTSTTDFWEIAAKNWTSK